MKEYFVVRDLPDNSWSVSWPGYEEQVVTTPGKVANLLKILFDEINVEEAQLGVCERSHPDKFETMYIKWIAWHQNPDAAARHVASYHNVVGCRFPQEAQARQFKEIMEKRLAWRRLSGRTWQ